MDGPPPTLPETTITDGDNTDDIDVVEVSYHDGIHPGASVYAGESDTWHIEKEVVHPFTLQITCENYFTDREYQNLYELDMVKATKNGNLKFLFKPLHFEGGYVPGPRWVAWEDFMCEVYLNTARLYAIIKRVAKQYKTDEYVMKCGQDFKLAATAAQSMRKIVRAMFRKHFEPLTFFNLDCIDFAPSSSTNEEPSSSTLVSNATATEMMSDD